MVLINRRPLVSYHERRSQVRFFCYYSARLTTAPDSTFTGRTAKHSTLGSPLFDDTEIQ